MRRRKRDNKQLPLAVGSGWEALRGGHGVDPNLPRYRYEPHIGGTSYDVEYLPPVGPEERRELRKRFGLNEK